MSKTTTKRSASSNGLQGIKPNVASGGDQSAVNRPGPSPKGPDPLIGEPEFLPQHTFIAEPGQNDNGFIGRAMVFHAKSGLKPRSVGSIEEIVELLGSPAETGSGVLDRIRIVSHFFTLDGTAEPLGVMGLKFFRDGGPGSFKRFFAGFASSSMDGLREFVRMDVVSSTAPLTVYADSADSVLTELRSSSANSAVVDAVFPPDEILHSKLREEFVILHRAKRVLADNNPISDATLSENLAKAYDLLITDLTTRLSAAPENVAPAKLQALGEAIRTFNGFGVVPFLTPADNLVAYLSKNLTAALAAVAGDSFRRKLVTARTRFDRYTTIDIRGCHAGTEEAYLQSVQAFFGRSDSVRPEVTAPKVFQNFQAPQPGVHASTAALAVAGINGIFNSGLSGHPAARVRQQFSDWATAYGITDTHLEFWRMQFEAGVLAFCALGWVGSIPQRRVPIGLLDSMPSASLADVIAKLGRIFFLRPNSMPTNPQMARIAPNASSLATWSAQLNTPIDPGQLAAHFDAFKTIYEAVDARMSSSAFHNSPQRLIPPAQPAGFSASQAQSMQTALKNFIQTNANSIFAPVRVFLTAADTATKDAPALMRYFLGLGLPFQMADTEAVSPAAQRVMYFDDQTPDGRQMEAVRHWTRAAWRGPTPVQIPTDITADQGLHAAWVQRQLINGPAGVCPHPSYMAQIVTLTA